MNKNYLFIHFISHWNVINWNLYNQYYSLKQYFLTVSTFTRIKVIPLFRTKRWLSTGSHSKTESFLKCTHLLFWTFSKSLKNIYFRWFINSFLKIELRTETALPKSIDHDVMNICFWSSINNKLTDFLICDYVLILFCISFSLLCFCFCFYFVVLYLCFVSVFVSIL